MTSIDSWTLARLREADEYNRANPDPEFADVERWVRDRLDAAVGLDVRHESPVADPAPLARPSNPTGASSGRPSPYAPSEKQLWLIGEMVAQRGLDLAAYQPRDKAAASRMIDDLFKIPRTDGGRGSQPTQQRPSQRMATERQLEYLQDLYVTRETGHGEPGIDEPRWESFTFEHASATIEAWKALPRRTAVKTTHGIRAGRYAFQPATGDAQFYIVDRNSKLWVQAGPARHPYNGQLNEALLTIQADPKAGAALYGQLIGACGRCGMALTDETSRAAGLGPHCAKKTEW